MGQGRMNLLGHGPTGGTSLKGRTKLASAAKKFLSELRSQSYSTCMEGRGLSILTYYLPKPHHNEENYFPIPRYIPRIVLDL